MTVEKCGFCGGKGRDPNSDIFSGDKPCPVCKGFGERTIDIPNDQLIDCRFCGGKGRDPNSDIFSGYKTCSVCKGWGLVQRPTVDLPPQGRKQLGRSLSRSERTDSSKKIFIVYGRDKTPALELARFVEKRYAIEAILLEEQAHRGRTLPEKLEGHSDVDFAFIILTPDDIGAFKGEPLRERGRQNVIFEWGHFIGKIGRENTCLLIKGEIEIPSDLNGIGYHPFTKNVKECFIDVETELEEAGLI